MEKLLIHRYPPSTADCLPAPSSTRSDDNSEQAASACFAWPWSFTKSRFASFVQSLYSRLRGNTPVKSLDTDAMTSSQEIATCTHHGVSNAKNKPRGNKQRPSLFCWRRRSNKVAPLQNIPLSDEDSASVRTGPLNISCKSRVESLAMHSADQIQEIVAYNNSSVPDATEECNAVTPFKNDLELPGDNGGLEIVAQVKGNAEDEIQSRFSLPGAIEELGDIVPINTGLGSAISHNSSSGATPENLVSEGTSSVVAPHFHGPKYLCKPENDNEKHKHIVKQDLDDDASDAVSAANVFSEPDLDDTEDRTSEQVSTADCSHCGNTDTPDEEIVLSKSAGSTKPGKNENDIDSDADNDIAAYIQINAAYDAISTAGDAENVIPSEITYEKSPRTDGVAQTSPCHSTSDVNIVKASPYFDDQKSDCESPPMLDDWSPSAPSGDVEFPDCHRLTRMITPVESNMDINGDENADCTSPSEPEVNPTATKVNTWVGDNSDMATLSRQDVPRADALEECDVTSKLENDSGLDAELDFYEGNDSEGDDDLDMDKVLGRCPKTEVLQNLTDMIQVSKRLTDQLEKALSKMARISCGPFPRLRGSGLTKREIIERKCGKLAGETEEFLGEMNKNFMTFYSVVEQMDNVAIEQDKYVSSLMVNRGPRDWRTTHASVMRIMDKLWSKHYDRVITRNVTRRIGEVITEVDEEVDC